MLHHARKERMCKLRKSGRKQSLGREEGGGDEFWWELGTLYINVKKKAFMLMVQGGMYSHPSCRNQLKGCMEHAHVWVAA